MDDTVALAHELLAAGVDVLDCSSGGNDSAGTDMPAVPPVPGMQVPFAERVRREVPGLATCAVGGISEPRQAEDILQAGSADCVAMARTLMEEPFWPVRAAKELSDQGFGVDYLEAGLMPGKHNQRLRWRDERAAKQRDGGAAAHEKAMADIEALTYDRF